MIASVAFRRFRALRNTRLVLAPFNLVVGPNGSGKTSLIQAIMQLRTLAALPLVQTPPPEGAPAGPEIEFALTDPAGTVVSMHCREHARCDALRLIAGDDGHWLVLRDRLRAAKTYLLDHYAIGAPVAPGQSAGGLAGNGANLAAVLQQWATEHPTVFAAYRTEVVGIFAEYDDLRLESTVDGQLTVALRLAEVGEWVPADSLSQGTLYALALCALGYEPNPAPIVCIEELDRGLHPRLLRQVRDVIYRLSYPADFGLAREPVQVIATTHSPYLLDLFRDHAEEIVIAEKRGRTAQFTRLADRADLAELLAEGSLGDIWFAGLLGGVPEEQ